MLDKDFIQEIKSGRPQGEVAGEKGVLDEKKIPKSPTVLTIDRWGMRRGAESLDSNKKMLESYKQIYKSRSDAEDAQADFIALCYDYTIKKAKNPEDNIRAAFVKELMENHEFNQLRVDTTLQETESEICSYHFAKEYVDLVLKEKEAEEQEEEGPGEGEIAAAASRASSGAAEDMESMDALRGLGGNGPDAISRIPKEQMMNLFRRVKKSSRLNQILANMGRYQRFAAQNQRYRTTTEQEEIMGLTIGGPIETIVPSELVFLCDENLEDIAYQKIAEQQYLSWDFHGYLDQQKGPIVVVVDESGSMDGEPIVQAKALALGMYWIAQYQKRWLCLVGFSGGTNGNYLVIPDGQSKTPELIDWLEHFYGGGTNVDVPLVELPKRWDKLKCPKGKTDIIVVTDALLEVSSQTKKTFLSWKEKELVKMLTIVIGDEPGDLEAVSDKCYRVEELQLGTSAVGAAMSI